MHYAENYTHDHLTPDPSMHTVITQKSLLCSDEEERPVRDETLLGDCAWVTSPCIEVSVEVDDGDGPVDFV